MAEGTRLATKMEELLNSLKATTETQGQQLQEQGRVLQEMVRSMSLVSSKLEALSMGSR